MNLRKKDLIGVTVRLIERYYAGRRTGILHFLHSQIIWFASPRGTIYSGIEDVEKRFFGDPSETRYISDSKFIRDFESAGIYRIRGEYNIYRTKERICPVRRERVFVIWIPEGDSWKLIQIGCDLISADVRKILKLEDVKRDWYFISMDVVMLVEARRSHCLIKGKYCSFEALATFSEMEKTLDRRFIKVHRSYLVNPRFVRRLSRFEILMEDGAVVPVPERRYREVKKSLLGEYT